MQQDDQNTFKNHTNHMITQNPAENPMISFNKNQNPIEKRNLLCQGFNYILPSFWYQQLIELNNQVKDLQNIQLPSLQTLTNFLCLSGLQNPTESASHHKKPFPKESLLFGAEIFEEYFYVNSKTLQFSKINNTFDATQMQWTVINPTLWNFIESKYKLSLQSTDEQSLYKENYVENQQNSKNRTKSHQIPKIAVFFTKQFIHEKGRCKGKEQPKNDHDPHACFVFKNIKYTIPLKFVNEEINRQLVKMSFKQINTTVIVDQTLNEIQFFSKIHVSGFFFQNLPFKEFVQGLIELQTYKNFGKYEKFCIFSEFGQELVSKIAKVENFTQLLQRKRVFICTSPLEELMFAQMTLTGDLMSIFQTDFIIAKFNKKENLKTEKMTNFIQKIENFFEKSSREKQLNFMLKKFSKNEFDAQSKPISQSSGFKPYNKYSNEIKILSGTFYRSQNEEKQEKKENSRQNDEIRYLDSATTNFDTPAFEYENQSEKVYSQNNYENARLKKHSSYNRAERKKKSLIYTQKKKKNNYILRDTAPKKTQATNKVSEDGDYKKRIKFPLFHSLCSLKDDPEALDYIVNNMRKLAQDSINNAEEHIKPILSKSLQTNEDKDFASSFQPTQTKKYRNFFSKKKDINPIERERQIKMLEQSLERIASQILKIYEPEMEKGEEQKGFYKFNEDCELKKDNEEIKTIIDNSEGPYSEVEKHSFNIKYRRTEKNLKKMVIVNDEIKSMSDGLNPIEDNDETI